MLYFLTKLLILLGFLTVRTLTMFTFVRRIGVSRHPQRTLIIAERSATRAFGVRCEPGQVATFGWQPYFYFLSAGTHDRQQNKVKHQRGSQSGESSRVNNMCFTFTEFLNAFS